MSTINNERKLIAIIVIILILFSVTSCEKTESDIPKNTSPVIDNPSSINDFSFDMGIETFVDNYNNQIVDYPEISSDVEELIKQNTYDYQYIDSDTGDLYIQYYMADDKLWGLKFYGYGADYDYDTLCNKVGFSLLALGVVENKEEAISIIDNLFEEEVLINNSRIEFQVNPENFVDESIIITAGEEYDTDLFNKTYLNEDDSISEDTEKNVLLLEDTSSPTEYVFDLNKKQLIEKYNKLIN